MRNPARISVGVSLVLLLGATMPALAQTYPDKPLRLFSDFPPGAPIDSLTRQIGA
jgi:tripartite-type tricarboxylate transporter receptor subunit TctC